MILLFLVALFTFLLFYIIFNGREKYGTLENCGFPVLKPSLFLGSIPNLHKEVAHLEDVKRYKKFGGIWGVYEGKSPQVFVVDPELIKSVFVKDFDYFHDRRDIDFGSLVFNEILDYLPGEKWKTVRSLLTPLFTTSKLKSMSGVIANVAQEFALRLKEKCNHNNGTLKIDTRKEVSSFLIDMFARSTLGVELENCREADNKFANSFRKMMGEGDQYGLIFSLSMTFPSLARFAPSIDHSPTDFIAKTFTSILEERRKSGKKANDFVELLNEFWSKVLSEDFKRLGICETTIISQAVNFFLGGYETSSTTSTFLLHYIASLPEVQKKLHEEIDNHFERHGEINHENLIDEELPYLKACLDEVLRLSPPLFRPERQCMKEWVDRERGIKIKKGTTVYIPCWATGRNPDFYENPEEFRPERFLGEKVKNQFAFTAFGHGPRNCIGIRFAYVSLKLTFYNLLRQFEVKLREDTQLDFKKGSHLVIAFNSPVFLDLKIRN